MRLWLWTSFVSFSRENESTVYEFLKRINSKIWVGRPLYVFSLIVRQKCKRVYRNLFVLYYYVVCCFYSIDFKVVMNFSDYATFWSADPTQAVYRLEQPAAAVDRWSVIRNIITPMSNFLWLIVGSCNSCLCNITNHNYY